eukprot:9491230-Lingulodinium_polyedra.AAC.1
MGDIESRLGVAQVQREAQFTDLCVSRYQSMAELARATEVAASREGELRELRKQLRAGRDHSELAE